MMLHRTRNAARKAAYAALGVAVSGSAVVAGAGPAVADDPQTLTGSIAIQAFVLNCPSPVGLCAHSTWSGSLNGTGTNVAMSIGPSDELTALAVSESETLVLPGGVLQLAVSAKLYVLPAGQFHSTYLVVGGSGVYANATGSFDVTGTSLGLVGSATYTGHLTTAG